MDAITLFTTQHPQIETHTPSSQSYNTLRTIFTSPNKTPTAIIRPSTVTDLSKTISFLTTNSTPFTIRSGGHDMHGRSIENNTVTIDLRNLNHISIDKASSTARIGGGILAGDLVSALQKEGYITPVGTVNAVGYVGWAMYGGYGLYSSAFGLGVDQIVGARAVNWRGEVVDADQELLKGIRGAGGAFGVLAEVEIKVYKLEKILAGPIIFQSDDLATVMRQYNKNYRALSNQNGGLPPALGVMQAVLPLPVPTFAMFFSWASPDLSAGKEWLEKICTLAPVISNAVQETTPSAFLAQVSAFVAPSTQGRMFTVSLREITDEAAGVIAQYTAQIPADPHVLFDIHELRGGSPSALSNSTSRVGSDSVFAAREPHFVVEICTIAADAESLEKVLAWGREFQEALKKTEAGNILPASYISFLSREEFEHEKVFGENLPFLRALKRRLDPGNVFKAAISYL